MGERVQKNAGVKMDVGKVENRRPGHPYINVFGKQVFETANSCRKQGKSENEGRIVAEFHCGVMGALNRKNKKQIITEVFFFGFRRKYLDSGLIFLNFVHLD